MRLQQQIHTLLERWSPSWKLPFCLCWCTCSVVHDGKDLSIFVWSPAVNAVSLIELSNHGPVSRGQPVNGSTALKPTTTFIVDKVNNFLSLGCQLETYPWPRPINSGSSGCNLDFAILNTCQGNFISSKKTKHSSVISSTEAVGDNWALSNSRWQFKAGSIWDGNKPCTLKVCHYSNQTSFIFQQQA